MTHCCNISLSVVKMSLNVLKIILCTFLATGISSVEENSFKDVTIEWEFRRNIYRSKTSSKDIKDFLPNFSTDTISIDVKGSVPILYKNAVSDIDNLEWLSMYGVGLEEIKPGAFRNLPRLKMLILDDNNITEIKTDTFRDLNLTSLILNSNSISTLQPGAFRDLWMRILILRNNKIETFSGEAFQNVTLETLHLDNNNIHRMEPKSLDGLPTLTTLSLSRNKLEELNPEAFSHPNLKHLYLRNNNIEVLRPGDFKNLPKLGSLVLDSNRIKAIPEGVFTGSKLLWLNLRHNEISSISPKAFDDMLVLRYLDIGFNNLVAWNNNWLHNTPQLSYLIAYGNQIEEIPDQAFKNYPVLRKLNLEQNKIIKISSAAFKNFRNVFTLNLSGNRIKNWNPNLLRNVNVTYLNLGRNELKCLNGDLKKAFYNAEFVNLDKNPWREECKGKIAEFLKSQKRIPHAFYFRF